MSGCTWSGCGMCGRCTSGQPVNATCPQCGEGYWRGRHDVGWLCDQCCYERDAEQARDKDFRTAIATARERLHV